MIEKPPERLWTREAIGFLAVRLGLRNEPSMQDWPFEVADPSDLDQYLSVFLEYQEDDDIRFVLADLIIQSFEELHGDLDEDRRWKAFLDSLAEKPSLHIHQIWYWSAFDTALEDAWCVSPYMRSLHARFA